MSDEKYHVSYKDAVNKIVDSNWGEQYESIKEASRGLIESPDRLTAYALVELLNRLNSICEAIGGGEKYPPQINDRNSQYIDDDSKKFPGKKVGEFVYGMGDELPSRYLITAKDEQDYCMVILANDFNLKWPSQISIAGKLLFDTPEESLQYHIDDELKYHLPKIKRVREIETALKEHKDISEFIG